MTAIKYPNEKFVKFQKYEALSEPRLTIFSDIESCHSKFEKLCNICVKAYNVCVDAETRRSIIKSCASENHSAFRVTNCTKCYDIYEGIASLKKKICDQKEHEKIHYKFNGEGKKSYSLCHKCHNEAVIEATCKCAVGCMDFQKCRNNSCEHSAPRIISSLGKSYSFWV